MNQAHQATAVAIGGRALLIEGPPGSGKSSLAVALIDRGATLIGDDGVMLEPHGDALLVHPHPRTRGLLEVRNLGLLPFACVEAVPAGMLVRLEETAPRYIEAAESVEFHGVALPMIRLWPGSPVLPLRAELAWRAYSSGPK